jgi:transcriptional regulator with XRE-family HTH domain
MTKRKKKRVFGLAQLERDFGPLTVAKMLASYRLGEELSATALAKKLGVSARLLRDFEKGRRLVGPRRAYDFGKKLGLLSEHWVEIALRDLLRSEKLNLKVAVESRARREGDQSAVTSQDDTVISKSATPSRLEQFSGLMAEAAWGARAHGLKKSDVAKAIKSVRLKK